MSLRLVISNRYFSIFYLFVGHFARECTSDNGGYSRGGGGRSDRGGDRGGRNNNSSRGI